MTRLHAPGRRRRPAPREASKPVLAQWLMASAFCIAVAGCLPATAAPEALDILLSASGYVWLALAITRTESTFGNFKMTAWDAALLSFAAAFAVQSVLGLSVGGA